MTVAPMRALAFALGLATFSPFGSGPADALECPAPSPHHGMISETASQQAELAAGLTNWDILNEVAVRTVDLRRRFPGVGDAELMDVFMMAYCPSVARLSGLSDAEKQARLDRFSAEIRPLIYQAR